VRRALYALPAEMRQVIVMKEYEDLTFAEIAEILQIPVSTVKSRLYTGLQQLRTRLGNLRDAL
jgi:RNA polymerase sigma-70 factor, ECF subfamily